MSISTIDHIQLSASTGHETLSREFYGKLLGLTEVSGASLDRPGVVRYSIGNIRLDIAAGEKPSAGAHLALRTRRLVDVLDRLKKAGVTPDAENLSGKSPRAYLRDPHGNVLELIDSQNA